MTSKAISESELPACVVCDEPAAPEARSDCYRCGDYFHLRLTTTATGPDCGDVWIDDEVMALQFACHNCLAEQRGEAAPAADDTPGTQLAAEPSPRRTLRAREGASARDLARDRARRRR
ncbi:MAG: hypothetical protein OXH13_09480 [Chloroflexi bacterium]|nr:hypothetical protein [Chloroflexota bacterium]MCY3697704.1 hypothetical protein [Chloroflexota bacterium]